VVPVPMAALKHTPGMPLGSLLSNCQFNEVHTGLFTT
jgi:hypothetical protein